MLRKFLFIGLGGSGGKTLRYLRHDLEQWLDQIGWDGDFPSAWQMLHIDTPTDPGRQRDQRRPDAPSRELPRAGDERHRLLVGLVEADGERRRRRGASSPAGGSTRRSCRFRSPPAPASSEPWAARSAWPTPARSSRRCAPRHMRLSAAQPAPSSPRSTSWPMARRPTPRSSPSPSSCPRCLAAPVPGLLLDTCDLLRQLPGTWARQQLRDALRLRRLPAPR